MKNWKKPTFFCIGGGGYVGLELLYRRRSHISMFFAGGICFLLLGEIEKRKLPVWGKGLLGAGAVTSVELLTGILWNRDHKVWDYRNLPGNFRGQICPLFSAVWIPLSLGGMLLYRTLEAWTN